MSSETTELFWDCECDEHYIHPKTETFCAVCYASYSADMPDSMNDEVMQLVADYRDYILYINEYIADGLPIQYYYKWRGE